MKNKIILSSVTLLSAFILAACGNGEKKANKTTAATTEVTTTADTSSEEKSVSYTDTQRIGRDDIGYVNVPKDWIITKSPGVESALEYSSKHKFPTGTLNAYTENEVPLQDRLKYVATTFYNTLKSNEHVTNNIDGEWTKVAGENAYVLKAQEKNGKYLYYIWFFQKGATVYVFSLEGTEENISTFRPMLEQSWGLDPNTPGK